MALEPDDSHSGAAVQRSSVFSSDELTGALAAHEFFLVYQPTFDLQTGAFAGVEALLRWRHPARGVISPSEFIDDLETSGQIVPVGKWSLDAACVQGAAWHAKGYRFAVSVNVSAKQFDSSTLTDDVGSALDASAFDASQLVLEFAQTTLTRDPATASSRLGEFKTLGVRLAVDDFAPERATISDLAAYPIDVVKVERAFIATATGAAGDASVLHELVQRAKDRHLQVIVSGIEDVDQRRFLQIEQVAIGQGFLLSTPHEAEEIDRLLENFAIFSGEPL